VVKLFVNGAWRSVKIDDYFPADDWGLLLCAYSSKGKLWVSILEKAYLKINDGYQFKGHNSSRDLYALTGWLPEKIKLDKTTDLNALWGKVYSAASNGQCLVTLRTRFIANQDEIGLASNHAYGVLEVVEY
jgi:calpain-7